MKKLLFLIILLGPALVMADNSDPFFNQTFYRDSNYLTVQAHTPSMGYDHSISYQLPTGEQVLSDQCSLKSATTLTCVTGDTAVYDAASYSVTLSSSKHDTFIYYVKGHQPAGSPLSGTWHALTLNCGIAQIIVPYADSNATTFYSVEEDYSGGGFSKDDTYYLIKDPDSGAFFFGGDPNHYITKDYGLYDANDKPISDMNLLTTVAKISSTRDYGQCTFIKY